MKKLRLLLALAIPLSLPLVFVGLTATQVLAVRLFTPFTPTMLQRTVEHVAAGEGLAWPARQVRSVRDLGGAGPRAVLAAEDARFYLHDGFDWDSVCAAVSDKRDGRRSKLRGASTITQQTAKNLFLWQGRSWIRKGLEVWYTVLLEVLVPKDRILALYLNVAETGPMVFGLEAGAQHHFHRSAADLTSTRRVGSPGSCPIRSTAASTAARRASGRSSCAPTRRPCPAIRAGDDPEAVEPRGTACCSACGGTVTDDVRRALKELPGALRLPVLEDGRVVELTVGDVGALPEAAPALFRAFPDLRALTLQNAANRVVGMRLDGDAVGRAPEPRPPARAALLLLRDGRRRPGRPRGLAPPARPARARRLRRRGRDRRRRRRPRRGRVAGAADAAAVAHGHRLRRARRAGAGRAAAARTPGGGAVRGRRRRGRGPGGRAAAAGAAGAVARRRRRGGRPRAGGGAVDRRGDDAVARLRPRRPGGVRALAEGFAGLQELDLNAVGADEAAVAALARAAFAPRLRALLLSDQAVGPGGALALASVPFAALGSLALSRAGLDLGAVRALSEAGALRHLASLSLAGTPLGAEAAVGLVAPALERLDLGACGLGDAGVARLVALTAPLRQLDLSDDDLGDAGATALAAWPALAGVRTLRLAGNRIGDAGALALAALPALEHLDLARNGVSPAGAAALKATPLWASGARVDLADNTGTAPAAAAVPTVGGTEADLVAALVRDPDDLASGQVWLDWLLGQGDPRADLVRAQLALAALPPDDPAAGPLDDEVQAWLRAHGAALLAPLRALGLRDAYEPHDAVVLRHGLVTRATFHAPVDFAAVGEALLAAAPALTELWAFGKVDHLVGSPVLPRLRTLSLYGAHAVQELLASPDLRGVRALVLRSGTPAAIAASPHLEGLEKLGLAFTKFGDAGVRTLVGPGSRLRGLRQLDLLGCGLGAGSGEAFASSALPLEELGLRSNSLGDEGVRALARGEHRWKVLELSGNGASAAALEALLTSATTGSLRSLTLQGNPLGDAGADVLAAHAPEALDHLDLGRCGLSPGGVARAASSPRLGGVRGFWLSDTPLDPVAAGAIGALPSVRRISLYACGIDDAAISALVGGESPALTWLSIGQASLGPRGAEAIAAAPHLGSLRALLLGQAPLGDAGVVALARSPHLRLLRDLGIHGVGLGPEGVRALVAAGPWGLRKLNLWQNPVGDDDVASLAAVLPDLAKLDLSDTAVTFDGLLALLEGPAWPHLSVLAARQIVPSSDTAARRRLEAAVAAHRPHLALAL
ncbi:MAG: transglycosylase domain-containing protein [Myxococcota bacterium]